MSPPPPTTPQDNRWIGALVAAAGVYFILVGFGLLPGPGGPRNLHAPLWIVLLVGVVFVLAGAAVLVQAIGRANEAAELPSDAPQWIRIVQYLIGVATFATFAMIGSWVAIGGDSNQFSSNVPFFGGASVARIMFGIGAAICWLATFGFAVSGARKLIRRRPG